MGIARADGCLGQQLGSNFVRWPSTEVAWHPIDRWQVAFEQHISQVFFVLSNQLSTLCQMIFLQINWCYSKLTSPVTAAMGWHQQVLNIESSPATEGGSPQSSRTGRLGRREVWWDHHSAKTLFLPLGRRTKGLQVWPFAPTFSILTSFCRGRLGQHLEGGWSQPRVWRSWRRRGGGGSRYLPSYVAASLKQRILFISDPGKCVRSLTLTEPTVCDCDLLRFCGATGHFDVQRTAGARLERFWSWLSWVGGKFT